MKKLTLILGLVFCSYSWAEVELIDVSVLKKRIENHNNKNKTKSSVSSFQSQENDV